MTDERFGADLLTAIDAIPRGSGIVFRHYSIPPPQRRRLFRKVREHARRRRHMLLLAGPPALAQAWGADGSHGWGHGQTDALLLRSRSVHDLRELRAAEREGADLIFVSPVLPTRSHPGARSLGRLGLARIARATTLPVMALGGMNAQCARRLSGLIYGWAGIDAFA